MKRKTLLALSAIPLALLLSSCFVLQGFWITATSVAPGQGTKAVFQLHAYSTTADKAYQFVVVGVPDNNELKVATARSGERTAQPADRSRWRIQPALAPAMDASGDCS